MCSFSSRTGHDGLNMPFAKCALLNYRKKRVWDELVADVLAWCARGAAGVRLAAAHCTPLILRSDAKAKQREREKENFD